MRREKKSHTHTLRVSISNEMKKRKDRKGGGKKPIDLNNFGRKRDNEGRGSWWGKKNWLEFEVIDV